jgi:hypothetical protein
VVGIPNFQFLRHESKLAASKPGSPYRMNPMSTPSAPSFSSYIFHGYFCFPIPVSGTVFANGRDIAPLTRGQARRTATHKPKTRYIDNSLKSTIRHQKYSNESTFIEVFSVPK